MKEENMANPVTISSLAEVAVRELKSIQLFKNKIRKLRKWTVKSSRIAKKSNIKDSRDNN